MDCCKNKDEEGCCSDLKRKTFFGYFNKKDLLKESKKVERRK